MSDSIAARAHASVINGQAVRNVVVRYAPEQPSAVRPLIEPFTGEIHSTVDINGIILITPAGFNLPASLSTPPDFSQPGAFDSYLADLAAAVPPVVDGQLTQTIVLHF